MSKLLLKGSMYGSKNVKTYSNPDILHSIVNKHQYQMNRLTIKFNKDKQNFFIYHSYNMLDDNLQNVYSGRWYNVDFIPNHKSFNPKKKSFEILLKNMDWEDFDTNKTKNKNVKIIIYFSSKGYIKLLNYFERHSKSNLFQFIDTKL